MSDVNANIGVHIDTSAALAELKNLQRQIATFHSQISKSSATAAMAQKNLQTNLLNAINATGKFHAQMGVVRTSTESFTDSLEKNKLSMREYFRYAGGASKTFGKAFKQEFDTIGKVAEERVKKMQTQYIKMGRDASGAMKAMSVTPNTLNMKDYGTQVALAAQKQALFNQLVKQGSTNLLNFGKNTQWAGRQLMVGFTVPLMYLGTAAAKTFMDLEKQAIKFKRVYGDMFTTSDETNKALEDVKNLAQEFTKYGVAVTKTMEMAASAAAMGKTGADLTAQVAQATRLAVLGNVEQEQALETTISLTNAFGIAAEDLTQKINFLNAVENQTVVSIEDLTIAVPKAGPVIQQLGGDVEDLAFFLTAMKEGGINASEGANALKSGLASLINPTEKAAKMLNGLGVNIKAIVEGNAGNIRETVIDFAQALDTLAPLERARAIEQLFGKFQFARLSTLFQNVTKDGTQASRVLGLAGKSVEELAILSERELKTVEDAVGTNFKEAIEQLKVAIAPIGKTFLETVTPIIKGLGNIFDKFNNLGDGTKKFIVVMTTLVGLIGPTLLMTFGLLANGAANIIKLFLALRTGFLKLTGNTKILGETTQYLNTEQLEAATVAASLNQAHTKLTQSFTLETAAVQALRTAYIQATVAATKFALANPGMMVPGAKGMVPKKFARGATYVPGRGNKDNVPAVLTPGEAVIPKNVAQDPEFQPIIDAMVNGNLQAFGSGSGSVSQSGKKDKSKPMSSKDAFAHVGKAVSIGAEDYIKQSPGLSEYDKARIRAVDGIERASGKSGLVTDYRGLGFSFDSQLNNQLAKKNGVPLDVFKKEWLAQGPEKWDATKDRKLVKNLYGSDNKVIDDAMFKKIIQEAEKSGGKVTDDIIKKSFQELPASVKSTKTYQAMSTAFEARSQYGVGKGMSHNPKTMEKKFKAAIAAGTIANAPVVIVDGDATTYNGKTNPLGKDGKPEKLSALLGSPGFELPEKSHVIVERTDSKGKKKSGSIFAYDPKFPQPIFISKGASTTRASVGRNPNLIPKEAVKEVKKRLSARSIEELKRIDADVRSSSMAKVKPTDFGKLVAPTAGYSFPVAGIGGVYEKDGKKVFVKPMVDEKSARAELRANQIARQAHGLDTPEQVMKTMADPNNKKRKIIVLESAFDPRFAEANMTGKFTKDQYFRQLTASLLRGDKDLKRGNLSGNILTDPGAAGVFDRASGRRDYSAGMKSMLSQAEINLLGVKGGASKDFAKATVDIPKGMTADQYHRAMIAEIDKVLPKLKNVVNSFGLTDPVEKAAYKDMIARLEKGKLTDWRGIHKMHSSVLVTKDEMLEDKKTKKLSAIKKKTKTRAIEPIVKNRKDKYVATVPKTKTVVQKPLRVIGRSDAPLSQADQIRQRAIQEGVSLSTARRRLVSEGQLIAGIKKQSDAVNNDTKQTNEMAANKKAFAAKLNTGVNVFSGLTIAASFTGGKLGELAQKITPFVILLSTLTMLGPALKSGFTKLGAFLVANPIVALAAIVATVALSFKIIDDRNKKMAEEQSKYIDSISATTEKMQKVGEITDSVGASQTMALRRQGGSQSRFYSGPERDGQQFGTNFLGSEVGKSIYETFRLNVAKGGTDAVKTIAMELAAYVSDGVMSPDQADSVARSIGIAMSDMTIDANIRGELRQVLGPEGQDLATSPLVVRLKIAEESQKSFIDILKEFRNATAEGTQAGRGNVFAASLAASGVQALEITQAQRDAQNKLYDDQIRALRAQLLTTADKEKQLEIEQQIAVLTEKQSQDDADIAQQRSNALNAQINAFKEIQKREKGGALINKSEGAFFTSLDQQIKDKYKNDPLASVFLDTAKATKSKTLEVTLKTLVGAGDITANAGTKLINMFGKEKEAELELLLQTTLATQDPGKFQDLINLTTGIKGKGAKKIGLQIFTEINAKGQEAKFDDRLKTLNLLQEMDGREFNLALYLEDPKNAMGKIDALIPMLKEVQKIKSPITKEVIQNLSQNKELSALGENAFAALAADWEHYVNLPGETQKKAISTFITIRKTITEDNVAEEARKEAEDRGLRGRSAGAFITQYGQDPEKLAVELNRRLYAKGVAKNVIPGGGEEDGGGSGKSRDTTLDALLGRLKMVRDAAINAEGGISTLLQITKGDGITKFSGVMQQLLDGVNVKLKSGVSKNAIKANREFLSFIENMDEETRKTYLNISKNGNVTFTEVGAAANEAFNEKPIGDFQEAQRRSIADTIAQRDALLKLRAAGIDNATALEMVADASLAVAINSKDISSTELQNMAKNAKAAKNEVDALNLALKQTAKEMQKDTDNLALTVDVLQKVKKAQPNISEDVLSFIASRIDIVEELARGFAGVGENAKEVDSILANVLKQKDFKVKISLEVDMVGELQSQLDTIGEKMNKYFAARRRQVEASFRTELRAAQSVVDARQDDVDARQEDVKKIQDQIDIMERDIESKRRVVESSLSRPIEVLQKSIDAMQREIEIKFSRPIEELQKSIETIERNIELNIGRTIDALQDESNKLSNDLTLIDRAAESINKKYDEQEKALQKIADINESIVAQEKQKISLADALTQGDISAAAQAAQDIRQKSAEDATKNASGVIQAARQAELDKLRNQLGMTRVQIEERQFQINQQTYQLELQRKLQQDQVVVLQDRIYNLEQLRKLELDKIRIVEDEIYAKEQLRKIEMDKIQLLEDAILLKKIEQLEPAQKALEDAEKALDLAQKTVDAIQKRIDKELAAIQALEDQWTAVTDMIDAAEIAAFNFTEQLKAALEVAQQLAAALSGSAMGGGTTSAFVPNSKASPDANQEAADAAKAAADAAAEAAKAMSAESAAALAAADAVLKKAKGIARTEIINAPTIKTLNKAVSQAQDVLSPESIAINMSRAILKSEPMTKAVGGTAAALSAARYTGQAMRYAEMAAMSSGGMVMPKYFAAGGYSRGTDTVPAMLTPGEFVMSKYAVSNYGIDKMKAMNSGAYEGEKVYNYNLSVNVKSDANPDDIARVVMTQIKQIDSQRIRTQRA